jgi:hypothetical protein
MIVKSIITLTIILLSKRVSLCSLHGQTSANRTKTWAEFSSKTTNLKLKTRPKQLLGFLPLDILLHALSQYAQFHYT